MRCFLLLTTTILVTMTLLPSPTVQTQQPAQDQFPKPHNPEVDTWPKPETYPDAPQNCKYKVQLAPSLQFPKAGPSKRRCEVSVSNCQTRGTDVYTSGPRPNGEKVDLNCKDYDGLYDFLARKVICCDAREEKPTEEKPSEPKCDPPTGWFDRSLPCKEVGTPQLEIRNGAATLYMCGYAVFSYRRSDFNDPGVSETQRTVITDHLKAAGTQKVCCEKFREAVRTGHPCDPSKDLDCDGIPNNTDLAAGGVVPDIDTFTRPDNAPIDVFPTGSGFDLGNPDFSPNRAARNSRGVGDCPCKWELLKGELKCSPPGRQLAYYQATWRCPKTGAEVITTKYISATEYRCGQ